MAVTILATPEAGNLPPRMRLDLDSGDPDAVFDSLVIRRNGQVIRAEAVTGSPVSVLYDYDCPFGTPVTYTAEGSTSGVVVLRDETWPNLTGWTTVAGTPAVASNHLVSGRVSRTLTGTFPASGRIRIADHALAMTFGPFTLDTDFEDTNRILQLFINDAADEFLNATYVTYNSLGEVVITWGDGQVTITSPEDSSSVSETIAYGTIPLEASAMGPFTLSEVVGSDSFDASSGVVQLDVTEAWLIHPVNLGLSVCVSTRAQGGRFDRIYVEDGSGEKVTYPSQREVFAVLGRRRKVPVTYGDRHDGEWTLVLRVPRPEDRTAMRSLLQDQSPILFQFPPSFPWDLDAGWYSVDDVDDDRVTGSSTGTTRSMTLPLTPVDQPVLTPESQWTYADDLLRNPTYADSLAEFPTYLDRLVGPTA